MDLPTIGLVLVVLLMNPLTLLSLAMDLGRRPTSRVLVALSRNADLSKKPGKSDIAVQLLMMLILYLIPGWEAWTDAVPGRLLWILVILVVAGCDLLIWRGTRPGDQAER